MRWLPESAVWIRSRAGTRFRWRELGVLRPYRRMVALVFVILLLDSEAYWFTYSWMPGYLELHRGLTALAASLLMIKMQYGGVLGYFVFGILADRYGRRPMFFIFGLVMAAGLLPETILWDRAAAIPGLIACAMFTAGFGTGIWSGMAPMISELLPTRVRNTTLGLLLNVTRGFQFFTPLAITLLSTRGGFRPNPSNRRDLLDHRRRDDLAVARNPRPRHHRPRRQVATRDDFESGRRDRGLPEDRRNKCFGGAGVSSVVDGVPPGRPPMRAPVGCPFP